MVKENNLIIENKKPFEIVQEVNNEILSFEEFMKNYEGNVNYDDLNETQRGYGPCPSGCEQMSQTEIRDRNGNYVCTLYGAVRFLLEVDCLNWGGGGGYTKYLTST